MSGNNIKLQNKFRAKKKAIHTKKEIDKDVLSTIYRQNMYERSTATATTTKHTLRANQKEETIT